MLRVQLTRSRREVSNHRVKVMGRVKAHYSRVSVKVRLGVRAMVQGQRLGVFLDI